MTAEVGERARQAAVSRAQSHAPFLADAIARWPELVRTFVEEGAQAAAAEASAVAEQAVEQRLRRQRHRLALIVALGDLAGELPLEAVTAKLSDFADRAIDSALEAAVAERHSGAGASGFAVVAMGKLGSRELNYSSDVDLLLLFDPAELPRREREEVGESAVRIGRRFVELLQKRTADGYVARVDLRLRPSPEVTPIVLPVDAAVSHYESSALPWERAAFIRARAAAGDRALGERFLSAIQPFVWRRSLDFGIIDEIRQISTRIRDHFAEGAQLGPGFDLKRGRGGIREAEFFVQIQQMIHGGRDPRLRVPATLDAVAALQAGGHLQPGDADAVAQGYRLLRTIEHRVQMVHDQQTHLLPAARLALDGVAQLHGVADGAALVGLLDEPVRHVGSLFDALAEETAAGLARDPETLRQELSDLGFVDTELPGRLIAEWRSAKPRSLRSPAAQVAFEAMLPALLSGIAAGSDPGHALNRLSDIVERLSTGVNFFRLLEARPELAALFARILAHAPALSEQLARRPELFEGLFDASSFESPPSAEVLAERFAATMRGHAYDAALDRVRRTINEQRFALGVQLIDKRRDPLEIAKGYSRIAEGAIKALASSAVEEFAEAHGRFGDAELLIVALGRLGGCALTHASDLDIIYLHNAPADRLSDGPKPLRPSDYFNRLASRVSAALSVPTAAGPLYEVDTRLRPQGSEGMLAVSLDAFADYQSNEAWTWEHMALCRARPVFGSDAGKAEASQVIASILRMPRDRSKVIADAAKMRADIATHKPAQSDLDVKLGRGGLVDLEFAVHVLQLTTGVGLSPQLGDAIKALADDSQVPANILEAQQLLTRMLVMMRLVAPGDVKPTEGTWQLVAECCGAANWQDLLAEHAAARHSIAELWDRIRSEG